MSDATLWQDIEGQVRICEKDIKVKFVIGWGSFAREALGHFAF